MDQLEPCHGCQRHVRTTETVCPFCSEPVAQAMAQVRTRPLPGTRLGRAALFAFGVGAGVAAVGLEGCADDDPQAAAPELPDEALDYANGGVVALYGAPPRPVDRTPRDAGSDAADGGDAGAATQPEGLDAGRLDPGGASFPLYAAPPLRARE